MKCHDAHQRMLTAEPHELNARGAGELSGHLSACNACRTRAAFISSANDALRIALPVTAAPAATRFTARRRRMAVGVSVAAGVVAVVVVGTRRPAPQAPPADRHATLHSNVVIDNAQGRDVAVLQGTDTTIIVFWNRGTR